MIFQAIVQSRSGAVVLDLPQIPSEIADNLEQIGVKLSPSEIRPHDSRVKVSLSSDSDFGKHLIPLFSRDESLADINAAASQIERAGEYVLADIENNVIYDQYDNIRELLYDISTDISPNMGM